MTNSYRALCAELVELSTPVDSISQLTERLQKLNELADRARELLAEPEAEGPSDEDLLRTYGLAKRNHCYEGELDDWPKKSERAATVAGIRAVLACWGHQPVPVPMSKRLPGPEDCDEKGRCWLGGHQMGSGTRTWLLGYPAWAEQFPDVHHFWLPAAALPLPQIVELEGVTSQ